MGGNQQQSPAHLAAIYILGAVGGILIMIAVAIIGVALVLTVVTIAKRRKPQHLIQNTNKKGIISYMNSTFVGRVHMCTCAHTTCIVVRTSALYYIVTNCISEVLQLLQ